VKEGEATRAATVAEAGEKAASLQGEIERLRGAAKEAEEGAGDAGARAAVLAEILAATMRSTPRSTPASVRVPDDPASAAGICGLAERRALRRVRRQRQDVARSGRPDSRARRDHPHASGERASALDAAKIPRADLGRILDAKVAVWKGIGAAADGTAKSMRRSTCAILSNEGWQGAEVDARTGELVAVAATASGAGARLGNAVGPEGEDSTPDYRVASDFGNGALVARIRGSELVHLGVPLIQPTGGKVEFRINDTASVTTREHGCRRVGVRTLQAVGVNDIDPLSGAPGRDRPDVRAVPVVRGREEAAAGGTDLAGSHSGR